MAAAVAIAARDAVTAVVAVAVVFGVVRFCNFIMVLKAGVGFLCKKYLLYADIYYLVVLGFFRYDNFMEAFSNQDRDELGRALSEAAVKIWKRNSNGVPIVLMKSSEPILISDVLVKDAQTDLERLGLSCIFHLTQTSKTEVYWFEQEKTGRQFVIRSSESTPFTRKKFRGSFPGVLSAFKSWTDQQDQSQDEYVENELLPLVAMDGLSHNKVFVQQDTLTLPYRTVVSKVMEYVAREAGFRCLKGTLMADLSLLSNGTPRQVDPDLVQDPNNVDDLQASVEKVYDLQLQLNLPKEMHWIDERGVSTQEECFSNPFLLDLG